MRKQSPIEVFIPEPCSQDWNDMHEAERGKFCDHCQKKVIDFTQMPDAALLAYVQQYGLGCGRFREDQLNRMIVAIETSKRRFWPQILLSLGMFFGVQKEASAQNGAKTVTTIVPSDMHVANNKNDSIQNTNVTGDLISIEGVLMDERGNPIVSGTIRVFDESSASIGGAVSDFDGLFLIKPLNDQVMGQHVTIKASSAGIDSVLTLKVDRIRNVSNIKLNLASGISEIHMLGGISFVHYTPWQRAKRKIRRTIYKLTH